MIMIRYFGDKVSFRNTTPETFEKRSKDGYTKLPWCAKINKGFQDEITNDNKDHYIIDFSDKKIGWRLRLKLWRLGLNPFNWPRKIIGFFTVNNSWPGSRLTQGMALLLAIASIHFIATKTIEIIQFLHKVFYT